MSKKSTPKLPWMVGSSLWIPSIAIPVGGAWGLQVIVIISAFYILISFFEKKRPIISDFYGWVWFIFLSCMLLLSSLFGVLPFTRSILSGFSEFTLLIVALAVYKIAITNDIQSEAFLSGFNQTALLMAVLAFVQFIGLNSGIGLFAWEINNPSFTLFEIDSAILHQRSYLITPEPSILSALLLSAIATQSVKVKAIGTHQEWLILLLFIGAMITTASQSLILIPFVIAIGFRMPSENNFRRRKKLGLLYTFIFMTFFLTLFFTVESLQRNFVERLIEIYVDNSEKTSYGERSVTIDAGIKMYIDYPILGAGVGSFSEILYQYSSNNDPLGAASTFIRNIAELGIVYFSVWILGVLGLLKYIIFSNRKINLQNSQLIVMAICFAFSAFAYIGYRTVYQNTIWFGIILAVYQINRNNLLNYRLR